MGAIPGTTSYTAAWQAALDFGKPVRVPAGAWKHGPLTVPTGASVTFDEGATVVPDFTTGVLQRLYTVSGDDVAMTGVAVAAITQTVSENKHLIYITGDRVNINRPSFTGVMISDGNSGATNLKVCHAIYIEGGNDVDIWRPKVDGLSGAAVFGKNANRVTIFHGRIKNTRWYSINVDHDCDDWEIAYTHVTGDSLLARYWGGSVNFMSQTTGNPNSNMKLHHCFFDGVHNYGSVVRVQSLLGGQIHHNTYGPNIANGSIGPDPQVQYVSIDRRGTAEGAPENGPCENVDVHDETMFAGPGLHWPFYLKNQHTTARDPNRNISIRNCRVFSIDASQAFANLAMVHGNKGGFDGLRITGNVGTVLPAASQPVSGGIGFVSTNSEGLIDDYVVNDNEITSISTGVPNQSHQLGIYFLTSTGRGEARRNRLTNFRYGFRTASGITAPQGANDNTYHGCLDNTLFQTLPAGPILDQSLGSTLPTSGVYVVGHVRFNPSAAASASPGWQVTTAGGAMVGAWASGQSYVAGAWYRNSSNRVYELLTAGGGTTADQPTGTTVGTSETGADGYVWLCRSTTAARWATLPALGAVAALP